jgi:hypothetical protein
MASLILHDQQIINQLKRLARKQGRSIDEILDDLLRSVETQDPEEDEETPSMKLARFAREANLVLSALPSDFDYDAFINQEIRNRENF